MIVFPGKTQQRVPFNGTTRTWRSRNTERRLRTGVRRHAEEREKDGERVQEGRGTVNYGTSGTTSGIAYDPTALKLNHAPSR